jgi:hypothetical protein
VQKFDRNIGILRKTPIVFRRKFQKSPKIVVITSTPCLRLGMPCYLHNTSVTDRKNEFKIAICFETGGFQFGAKFGGVA